MMNNKRGMSTIITTVIMVALALVAVGIVWAVVSGILQDSATDIGSQADCLKSGIEIVKATQNNTNIAVVIKRSQGSAEIGGVALVAYYADGTSATPVFSDGNIAMLASKAITVSNAAESEKVSAVIYFKNTDGENKLCTNTAERKVA